MIIQYWHSESPPAQVVDVFNSFPEHNPGLRHIAFDESKADQFIAEHFSARELEAFRSCAVPAMQADYFRYCAVFKLGGLYADADLQCVGDVRSLLAQDGGILFGRQGPLRAWATAAYGWPYEVGPYHAIGNGLFAFRRPCHPLLEAAIEIATTNIEKQIADGPLGVWLTAGPGIFTSMYLLDRLGSIDAFISYSKGSILEPSASQFCEIVEDLFEVGSVFETVTIRSRNESDAWVNPIKVPRPRWGPAVHWQEVTGSIFR